MKSNLYNEVREIYLNSFSEWDKEFEYTNSSRLEEIKESMKLRAQRGSGEISLYQNSTECRGLNKKDYEEFIHSLSAYLNKIGFETQIFYRQERAFIKIKWN